MATYDQNSSAAVVVCTAVDVSLCPSQLAFTCGALVLADVALGVLHGVGLSAVQSPGSVQLPSEVSFVWSVLTTQARVFHEFEHVVQGRTALNEEYR